MVNNISEIKKFGVFQDYKKNISDFSKFNLFYGWNGSGKSTLSALFNCMAIKKVGERFSNSEFKIQLSSGEYITNENIGDISEKIFVFNEDFINQNIDWNDTVKSILMISEEKIEERKRLEELLKTLKNKKVDLQKETNNLNRDNKSIEKMLTDIAKNIKIQFTTLNTSDTYYINYNKAKLKTILENKALDYSKDILGDEEILKVKDIIKPQKKERINIEIKEIDISELSKFIDNINRILGTTVVSNTIQELLEDSNLAKWIENGIELHDMESNKQCKFCGNILNENRLNQLNSHFNDNFKVFQGEINLVDKQIEELIDSLDYSMDVNNFYDEFKPEAIKIRELINNIVKNIVVELKKLKNELEQKRQNPFIEIEGVIYNFKILNEYNEAINEFNRIVKGHNDKCDNFNNIIKVNQKKLEKHYAIKLSQESNYNTIKKNTLKYSNNIVTLGKEINRLQAEADKLENSIINEGIAIPHFNNMLSSFLGHNEIELEFDKVKKGYKIIRKENREHAKYLSEGEKTAIAFIYFMIKLKENGNRIQDSIVVLDDPISSFDSKHIHNAYAYIKNEIEDCKQLFVLTHNFTFFKLIRDWIIKKNNKDKIKSRLYKIEVVGYTPKVSYISNIDESLEKYNSEYHYLFTRLFSYSIKPSLSLEETFMAANTSRKLLEAFMNFKKPKNRKNFKVLFDECVENNYLRERVYKFINKYSHYTPAIMGEEVIDNLLAESNDVIMDVFKIYKNLDEVHFNEMIDISKKCLSGEYTEAELEAATTKM